MMSNSTNDCTCQWRVRLGFDERVGTNPACPVHSRDSHVNNDGHEWHLMGIEGCVHEHDEYLDVGRGGLDEGASCDCAEGNAAVDALTTPDQPDRRTDT